ncbi:TPA: hypothetical protein UMV36_003934 [Stenotrophomonas maltophilia]|nr:hypothetical protein [Stenotrophomonas maltophilia]MBH1711304.1 hypothetical protein [Stenotrophomonas maltophilia]HEL3759494.1 hypothetical protein [Stenotrophomonas maltophilia]
MKKPACALVLLASLGLTACGSSVSCSSSDVKDTLRSIFTDTTEDSRLLEALDSMEVTGIATLGVDKELGNYRCSAELRYEGEKRTVAQDVEYTVQAIESDDADFQIRYNTSEFGRFKTEVAGTVGLSFSEILRERLRDP